MTASCYGVTLWVIASPHTPRVSLTPFSPSAAYVRFSGSRQIIDSLLPPSRRTVNKPQVRRRPSLPAIKHSRSYLPPGYIAFSMLLGKFTAALRVARSTHLLLFEKWITCSSRLGYLDQSQLRVRDRKNGVRKREHDRFFLFNFIFFSASSGTPMLGLRRRTEARQYSSSIRASGM